MSEYVEHQKKTTKYVSEVEARACVVRGIKYYLSKFPGRICGEGVQERRFNY